MNIIGNIALSLVSANIRYMNLLLGHSHELSTWSVKKTLAKDTSYVKSPEN